MLFQGILVVPYAQCAVNNNFTCVLKQKNANFTYVLKQKNEYFTCVLKQIYYKKLA